MPATIRLYEVVYIIAPDRSDEQVQSTVEKYRSLIGAQGGVVVKTDIWERRRLAYVIGGYNEGLYVVTYFRGLPVVEAELRRVFRISEDTLRYVIVRPDDESVLNAGPGDGQPRQYVPEPAPAAPVAAAAPTPAPVAEPAAVPDAPVAETSVEAPVAEAEPELVAAA